MKIALYIADGLEQIILTPEDDGEKAILGKLTDDYTLSVKTGQFYVGRDSMIHSAPAGYTNAHNSTYIFLVKPKVE